MWLRQSGQPLTSVLEHYVVGMELNGPLPRHAPSESTRVEVTLNGADGKDKVGSLERLLDCRKLEGG